VRRRSRDGAEAAEDRDGATAHGRDRRPQGRRRCHPHAGAGGFPPEAVTVLLGEQDADRIDSLGKQSGPWKKLWRAVQFTQTDQMVDLVAYEAALRDGRAVVTVHTPRAEARERAKRVLAAAGAHFMNFFGRLSTEDISRWRGKELPRHPNLYR
jgi:hypothetical protein